MKQEHLSNVALAKKLSWDEKEIRRLLDPYYCSKFPKLEQALNALGLRLKVCVSGI